MPQVEISQVARNDMENLAEFLIDIGVPEQAKIIITKLNDAFKAVGQKPNLGRHYQPVNDETITDIREYKMRHGKSGYSFLYRHEIDVDTVVILTVKHYRERNYTIFN